MGCVALSTTRATSGEYVAVPITTSESHANGSSNLVDIWLIRSLFIRRSYVLPMDGFDQRSGVAIIDSSDGPNGITAEVRFGLSNCF